MTRRLLLVAGSAAVLGYPVLRLLETRDLAAGNTGVLAALLTLTFVGSSTAGQRLLGEGQPWDRPLLRLSFSVLLIAVFAGAIGWSVAVPVGAFVVVIRQIQRSSSCHWRSAGLVVTVAAVASQVGVQVGMVDSIVPAAMSHVAAASILGLGWVGLADVGLVVTQRKRSQDAVARAEARLRALMESSRDVLTVSDATGALTYVSPAALRSIGHAPQTLIGSPLLQLVDAEQRSAVATRLAAVIEAGLGAHTRLDVLVVLTSGERRWYEWTIRNLLDDRFVRGLVVDQRDVTDRRLYAQGLAHAAAHDQLTGLPNRGELLRRLAAALPEAAPGAGVAVLFIDLDRFKLVNDTYGHAAGDQLLAVVAQRLQSCLRSHDHLARLGGDEFCAILTEVRKPSEVSVIVGRLEEAVTQPVALTAGMVSVGASIGAALTTDARQRPAALFAEADAAMYAIKRARTPESAIQLWSDSRPGPGARRQGADPGRATG